MDERSSRHGRMYTRSRRNQPQLRSLSLLFYLDVYIYLLSRASPLATLRRLLKRGNTNILARGHLIGRWGHLELSATREKPERGHHSRRALWESARQLRPLRAVMVKPIGSCSDYFHRNLVE